MYDDSLYSLAREMFGAGWRSCDYDEMVVRLGFSIDDVDAICEIMEGFESETC